MIDSGPRLMLASALPWIDAIVIVIFLGLTIGFIINWGRGLWMAWTSRRWPAVTGTIISSKIVSEDIGEGATRYDAKLVYEYGVAGEVYRADRLEWSDGMSNGSKRRHEHTVTAYPVGRSVTVYYDPADPARAVLEPRRLRGLLMTGAFASALVALTIWMATNGLG